MLTPVTMLDERYSSPSATAAGWEETRRVLETAELFWVSTVRADGRPHVDILPRLKARDSSYYPEWSSS
jgi:predicted pyridoxine 5'-phosphate oxidase superfamily flavin-nucleotide-binding protein